MSVTVNNSPVIQDYIHPDYQIIVELAYRCSPSIATLPKMDVVGRALNFYVLLMEPLYMTTISYLANSLLYDQIRMCLMCFGARNNKV